MIEQYTFPLALEAWLPVLLYGIGLFLLARMLKRKNEVVGELAFAGVALIVVGEVILVMWKLLNALTGADHHWMTHAPMALRAPGSICLAWALWQGLRNEVEGKGEMTAGRVWLLPLGLNAVLLALTAASRVIIGGRAWFSILFTVTMAASLAIGLQLARRAIHHQLLLAALLFLVNLVMFLALSHWIARDETAEWAKQLSNTISQAAFAFAAFQLAGKERERQ